MKNKKILITGGAGYIGSKLVDSLIMNGNDVVVIDNLSNGKVENINKRAKFYKLDINSPKIFKILEKERPDIIYHLAASKSVNDSINNPTEFAKINIVGSVNVIDSAYKLGIKKIIFTSTAGVYGNGSDGKKQKEDDYPNPSSPYAWTKLVVEQYISYMNQNHGMEGIILRFANVYGPGNSSQKSVVDIFVERILNNQKIIIHGDGLQTRDFVFIDDLVDACMLLTELTNIDKQENLVFNISTGKETSILELLQRITKITRIKPAVIYKKSVFTGQKRSVLDTTNTKRLLGWETQNSLEEGLLKTIRACKNIGR